MNARILHRCVLLLAFVGMLGWFNAGHSFVRAVRGGSGPSESLAWSPDGTQIVFSAYTDNGSMDIFVMDADESNLRNLSNSPEAYDYHPAWSPDGTRIAFTSGLFDEPQKIYVVDANGTTPPRPSDISPADFTLPTPVWSPNGTQIAYFGRTIIDAGTGNVRPLAENYPDAYFLGWSPDGSQIAFAADLDQDGRLDDIFVVAADGRNPRNLTNSGADDVFQGWSPDGTQIAYESDQNGDWDIYVIDLDGNNLHSLASSSVDEHFVGWSPDGTRLLYVLGGDFSPITDIFVITAETGHVSRHITGSFLSPQWSPDGTRITAEHVGDFDVSQLEFYVINIDDPTVSLTVGTAPVWSPDGTQIAFRRIVPGDVCLMDADGTNIRCLPVSLGARIAWSSDGQRFAYWEVEIGIARPSVVGIDEIYALPTVTPAPIETRQS